MVRVIEEGFQRRAEGYKKYAGLSLDTKPTPDGLITGSEFLEVDTGLTYYYDEEDGSWCEPPSATTESEPS